MKADSVRETSKVVLLDTLIRIESAMSVMYEVSRTAGKAISRFGDKCPFCHVVHSDSVDEKRCESRRLEEWVKKQKSLMAEARKALKKGDRSVLNRLRKEFEPIKTLRAS